MRRIRLALWLPAPLLLAPLLLAGCQRSDTPPAPIPENDMAPVSGLERAALATGVIADVSQVSPVGVFQRRHEAGRDRLCIVADRAGDYRFGMEAIFGADEHCRGKGTARRAGDKLILHFSGGSRCLIVAQYDGDRVALPGVVDMKCDALCSGRGSLEGVALPRISGADGGGDSLCAG